MNMNTQLRNLCLVAALLTPNLLLAQNVGIGTNTPAEKLHVVGNIRATTLAGVNWRMVGADANGTLGIIAAGTNGQVLTQTAGGPAWQAITAWQTTGNSGTAAATNFIGTTDNVDFVTRTNNIEAMRVTNAQRVGIGTATPLVRLDVSSGAGDAIFGHSANVGAYLGYETNFTFGTPPQSINGSGVWASNPAAGYTSIFAQSSGAATVAASIAYSSVWMAGYNYVENASATFNPSATYHQLNVTNATIGGGHNAINAYSNRGTTAGNPGFTVGLSATSNAQNQDAFAVNGGAFTNAPYSFGGAFEGLNYAGVSYAYAYVGGTPNGVTARKIIGTGTVSEVVPTPNHGRVTLTAPESPEYFYQDYGTVQMTNGFAHVDLDPILAEIIVVDASNPLRVFATPVSMPYFNGVTIMNQTATGFDLVELNGGTHSGRLEYQLVCKPKTNFGEGRFPQAPGPSYLKPSMEPAAAKAANQPTQAFRWPADHIQYNYDPAEVIGVGAIVPAGPNHGKLKVAEGKFIDHVPATKPQ
jgi:hypothetical protein